MIKNNIKKTDKEYVLSIIIPIYNSSTFLKKCINSILNSKNNNSEIILINDGSTDNSLDIIKEYSKKYEFIRYIDKKNEGLAATKNLGIKLAKGKYISFIDSDDSINENFYKEAEQYLKKDYDMIIYDFNNITEKDSFITEAKSSLYESYKEKEALLYTSIMPSSCNKIVKKELFINNDIYFPEGIIYEDLATTPLLFTNCKKIKYINKPYYNYFISNPSIMRSDDNIKKIKNMIKSLNILYNRIDKCTNYNREEFLIFNCLWRIEDFIFDNIYRLKILDKFKYINLLKKSIPELLKEIYANKKVQETFNNLEDDYNKNFYLLRNKYILEDNYTKLFIFLIKNSATEARPNFCYDFNKKIIKKSN